MTRTEAERRAKEFVRQLRGQDWKWFVRGGHVKNVYYGFCVYNDVWQIFVSDTNGRESYQGRVTGHHISKDCRTFRAAIRDAVRVADQDIAKQVRIVNRAKRAIDLDQPAPSGEDSR